MSIASEQIRTDWELGDAITVTMGSDGDAGDDGDGGSDGDGDGGSDPEGDPA